MRNEKEGTSERDSSEKNEKRNRTNLKQDNVEWGQSDKNYYELEFSGKKNNSEKEQSGKGQFPTGTT